MVSASIGLTYSCESLWFFSHETALIAHQMCYYPKLFLTWCDQAELHWVKKGAKMTLSCLWNTEKHLVVLMGEKLGMNQQSVLATAHKAHCLLLPVGRERWFFPSTLLSWDPSWNTVSSSGVFSTRKTWTCWSSYREGHTKLIRGM